MMVKDRKRFMDPGDFQFVLFLPSNINLTLYIWVTNAFAFLDFFFKKGIRYSGLKLVQ